VENYTCFQINIFKNIPEDEKKEVTSLLKTERFSKGETIFTPYEEFEDVYMVHTGEVIIYQMSPEGKKIITEILRPGDIFSNFSLVFNSEVQLTDFAEAIEDSEICTMNKEEFAKLIKKYPKIALNVIKELGRKLSEADARIRDLALYDATIRAINELLRLSKKDGTEIEEGKVRLNTRITHEEFAEMIGTSRETATKLLKKLHGLGFIDITPNKHIIVNTNKIKEPL